MENIADETLNRLSETLDRYAASAISTIPIPEFRGLPGEDVFEFIQRFKLATLTFSEELRCLALNKALIGSAQIWAKESLKSLIKSGHWKPVKKALIERFAAPDQELRHQQKLMKMKFDDVKGSLTSYIEEYAACYRKAFTNAVDTDIIKSLSLNLPSNIVRHLNILSENWVEFQTMALLYSLVKRLESKILPYESIQENKDKASIAELSKTLLEMQATLKASLDKKETPKPDKEPEEAVALMGRLNNYEQRQGPDRYQMPLKRPAPYERFDNPSRNRRYVLDRRGPQAHYGNNQVATQQDQPPQYRMLPPKSNQASENQSINYNALKSAYEQRYGKPPGPCYICGGEHFNRHCLYRDLN